MRPDWERDGIQLYCADCMDVLPHLSGIDAVVTDPPYGIGSRMQGGTWGSAEKYGDFRGWDVAPTESEILSIVSCGRVSIVWGGNYFSLPPSRCWLAWDKQNAVPTMADVELAWTNLDRPAKRFSAPVGVHSYGHPTEKPLGLMVWCVDRLPRDAETILDPFMGSGTTGVACVKLGRKFIGIEKEPKYFEISVKRIERALSEERSSLFPVAKEIQRELI